MERRLMLFPFQHARIFCDSMSGIGILWPKMSEILCAAHGSVPFSFNDRSSQNTSILIAYAFK